MRHPIVRTFQALAALALTAAAALGHPAAPAPEAPVWIGVVGEIEQPQGGWQGADLLAAPDERVDRFQVSVRSERPVHLRLEAVTPEGTVQIYPARIGDGLIGAGRSYALPAPHAFFEIRGDAQLRIVLTPLAATSPIEVAATPSPGGHPSSFLLSDGASFRATERAVRPGQGPSVLTIALHGR